MLASVLLGWQRQVLLPDRARLVPRSKVLFAIDHAEEDLRLLAHFLRRIVRLGHLPERASLTTIFGHLWWQPRRSMNLLVDVESRHGDLLVRAVRVGLTRIHHLTLDVWSRNRAVRKAREVHETVRLYF